VTTRDAAALAILSATAAFAAGCHRDGCIGGDDGSCVPPTACAALRYACDPSIADALRQSQLTEADLPVSTDAKARATVGDFVLENDLVRVVISDPSHPSDLAPTGGAIIDLAPLAAGSTDQINSIYQAAGLLPRDAVHYDDHVQELGGPAEGFVALVFRGHLEGDSRVTVVTRYELRPCEPGVRVRSDLYNGAPDPNTLYLADGLFWGDNGAAPFVPGVGLGFRAPALNLKDASGAWREWPFVAARTQVASDASYARMQMPPDVSFAVVPCDPAQGAGFNDTTLTAAGVPLATTLPGDGIHLERFIIATPGPGLAPAVGEALRVRTKVHADAAPVTVAGRVVAGGAPFDGRSGRAASLLFYEPAFGPDPDDPARRKPWSEAVPGADGHFSVVLPPDRAYRVQPYAFGLPAGPAASFLVAQADVDIGDLTLTASAHLIATVMTTPGQTTPDPETYAELVVVPMTPPTGGEAPSFYGLFPGCNPMLGPPHGGSPACNRALTADGHFDLLIPAGQYYVYATRGPFATLDRAEISVGPGDEAPPIVLVVQSLPSLLPAGDVSGDFHVHGAASFDSSIPDQDRVVSFLSSGVDMIVATDHNVVTSYASTLAALDATDRLVVVSGVEQTPNIPWFAVPGQDLPRTLGHFNFWPLALDPTQPRNGAPWTELREPGQMMDDVATLFAGDVGVRQLNHPLAASKLERDQGFLRAIDYDPRTQIVAGAGFAADVLLRKPGGSEGRRNLDWDVQEVMTGSSPADWLRYRALWFSLLSQGILRAGTANSDTHSLSLGQVGYPRNVVFPDPTDARDLNVDPHDIVRFDDHVRRGRLFGTTGPVLTVTITDPPTMMGGSPTTRAPSLQPITVTDAAQLNITISAAPWVPVKQFRVIVNGMMVNSGKVDEFVGVDHFGAASVSATRSFLLKSLLDNVKNLKGDAWLIVEAGIALDDAHALDGDGLPVLSDKDLDALADPTLADYHAIVPGAWPVAFSNPFLLNLDGNGWDGPGLP